MPKKAPAGAKRSKQVAKDRANYYNEERNKQKSAAKEFCNDLIRKPTGESHVFQFSVVLATKQALDVSRWGGVPVSWCTLHRGNPSRVQFSTAFVYKVY